MSNEPKRGPCLLCVNFQMDPGEHGGCTTCGSVSASMGCSMGFWSESAEYSEPKDIRKEMRRGWTCKHFALAPDCGPEDAAYLSPDRKV